MPLRVQRKQCASCIFRPDCSLDLTRLLDAVRETPPANWPKDQVWPHFKGHRVCHHSKDAVCGGFWARHKDDFQLGQLAQRLNLVEFVQDDDIQKGEAEMGNKNRLKGAARRQQRSGGPIVRNGVTLQRGVAPRYDNVSDEEMLRHIRLSRERAMREAIDVANGRLEPKQASLPLEATWTQPSTTGQRVSRPSFRPSVGKIHVGPLKPVEVDVPVSIEEADLLAGINEAIAAHRTAITPAQLAEMLANGPGSPAWRSQRGFVRQR